MAISGEKKPDIVLQKVKGALDDAADKITPWFFQSMPAYYFKTHTEDEQVRHLNAIISGQVLSERQTVSLRSPCGKTITYISPCKDGSSNRDLLRVLERHLHSDIETARFYMSRDEGLRLDTLILAPQDRADVTCQDCLDVKDSMREHMHTPPNWPVDWPKEREGEFESFLASCSVDYVDKFEPERAARHFRQAMRLRGREEVEIVLEPLDQSHESRISISLTDPPKSGLLLQVVKILNREGVTINRGYADSFRVKDDGEVGQFALVSLYVSKNGARLEPDSPAWAVVEKELRLVKALFAKHHLEAFADENGWSMKRVMLLQAAEAFAHQFLIKNNLFAFTSSRIVYDLLKHREQAEKLVTYFEARFDPLRADREAISIRLEREAKSMIECVESETARQVFDCILTFFKYTLRTNYYFDDILGLGFRLDPAFLPEVGENPDEAPFGVYFFTGPYAQGFHVRYREMSRGGLRVVRTWTQEQFELESNRLYDEVTGLASSQQLKNKDIPEGGSKGVMLLGPEGDVDQAVKSYVNSFLDLILTGETGPALPKVADYLKKEEIIFLGPDERIEPRHINWTVRRAEARGYKWPTAFMSSKPRAGINHKEYGVTSEGVIVFAEELLKYMGIDPRKQPFTVKMTGGPRGDVAGNAVKIMLREYGANAHIVCMTDGHGAAYDPDGLNHAELMRLVQEEKDLSHFNPDTLTGQGAWAVTSDTQEGARLRNTLHNTAKADIFIPSGGRPDTINMKNWKDFMDSDGSPSARAAVEGANIFISKDARTELENAGVLVVYGSSANKTGVICSSYEILASLIMSEDEFLEIKEEYVEQVLGLLKVKAAAEARLMMEEHKAAGGKTPLSAITLRVSQEINKAGDALYEELVKRNVKLEDDPDLCEVLFQYCPPILIERYKERLIKNAPRRHLYAVIAAFTASRIVYAEGMGWLEEIAEVKGLDSVVRAYLLQEERLARFVAELRGSDIGDRDAIAHILEGAGMKLLTTESLGLG